MRHPAVLGLLLLGACDRSASDGAAGSNADASADASAVEKTAKQTKAAEDPATAPAEPAVAPTKSTPDSAGPYRRKGDPAKGVDEFVFWGWSEDDHYYAFETFHHGAQMANCEGEAELTIVDAQTDRYAEDGHVLLTHANAEAEVCDPPDLREELALRRAPRLERYGIAAHHIGGPIPLTGGPERFSVTLPDGGPPIEVIFRVKHGSADPMDAVDGAAFELRIKQPGMSQVVVEHGHRRRPWTLDYGLDEGMVFVGPKGGQAAIMVAQRQTMPEGIRTTWMSSGITLR